MIVYAELSLEVSISLLQLSTYATYCALTGISRTMMSGVLRCMSEASKRCLLLVVADEDEGDGGDDDAADD
jgi:hypothetical protein